MVETIPFYAYFSITAMLMKFGLLCFHQTQLSMKNSWFLGFFLGLLGVNVFELCCIIYLEPDGVAVGILKAYHLSCLLTASMLLGLILRMLGKLSPWMVGTIAAGMIGTSIVVILPGQAIDGARSLGFAISRIPGPFYWIFQLTSLTFLVAGFSFLAHDIFRGASNTSRRRSKALFLSAIPIFVTSIFVVVLMQLGFQINAVGVGSASIIFFLIALIITENEVVSINDAPREELLCRFLALWPATAEFELTNLVRKVVSEQEKTGLPGGVEAFERAVVLDVLNTCNGNKSLAAKRLGISRTTLRRKLADSGLSLEDKDGQTDSPLW